MAKKYSKYDDVFFNDNSLIIREKLFYFLNSWEDMNFSCNMDIKGIFYINFNIIFLNSTIVRVTKSKIPHRPFTSSDLFELTDAVMFFESYLNYKAHFVSFKHTRNEFSMSIRLIPN